MERKDNNKNETSYLRMCTAYTRILGGSCIATVQSQRDVSSRTWDFTVVFLAHKKGLEGSNETKPRAICV
jgi:hypothetical protein